MVRIGWIRCGAHAGEMLLPQFVRLDARLDALCDIAADRLARIADRYGVGARYTDPAALLAHPGLDAIGMAVGPAQHAPLAAETLARGLPVFIEKPPAPPPRTPRGWRRPHNRPAGPASLAS
jgi:myo-inositol 2-dehydrogenase/D-chiro-inositol 1-dehydrogenase